MISAEQLNQVFRFKHQIPSTLQDEASCKALVALLCGFVHTIEPIEFDGVVFGPRDLHVDDRVLPVGKFTVKELGELKRVCRQLRGEQDPKLQRGDNWVQEWLPAYGCALEVARVNATCIELWLVFLDGWELELHTLPNGEIHHSAVSKTFNAFHCGQIRGKLLSKLKVEFHRRLMEAKKRTGEKRNAAANEEGHQMTPQFIAALLLKSRATVLKVSEKGILPRGGTTDVGLHTGGSARDTCWPLVRAVLDYNLCGSSVLAEKCVVHFELALLEKQLRLLENKPKQSDTDRQSLWASAEEVFEILTKIVLILINFLERGYDITVLKDQCESQRKRLNAVIEAANGIHAAQFTLPSDQDIALLSRVRRCPKLLSEPAYLDPYQLMGTRSMSESELKTNLGFCELVDGAACSATSLIQWLSHMDSALVEGKLMIVLSTIEDFMFRASQSLVDQTFDDMDLHSPSTVYTIVQVYQQFIGQWQNQPLSEKTRCMEQQSHELLVIWIAFCIVHRDCARSWDNVNQYGIALEWQRLEVLVLSEKSAIDAMKNVAICIRKWNERSKPPLFHLNDQTPTFDFALAIAQRTDQYNSRYLHEMNWKQTKIAALWRTIEAKKHEAERLRTEIRSIMADLATENSTLAQEKDRLAQMNVGEPYYRQRRNTPEIGACNCRIRGLSGKLSSRERRLRDALAMPSFIVSPIPEQKNEALTALFFLDMPNDVGILAHLCLTAQRALGPFNADSQLYQTISGATCEWTWLTIYNRHKFSSERFSSQFVTAFPGMFRVPRQYGPSTVDNIYSETGVARECVWYPQFSGTSFLWNDLSGQSVNPYNISRQISIEYFTEALPNPFKSLQWAVAYPGGEFRGNLVYSKLDDQPADDFDRTSYLTFGSLRSFPNQQVRKLCCALKDNQLPWSNCCVKILVRQALFQIGHLTNEIVPHMSWKTDFLHDEGLLVFFQSMDHAATRIELTPRDYECVPLLAELAGFLSQFMPQAFSIAKRFGAIARRWANEAKFDQRSERYVGTSDELRVKECLLYGYAICCYRLGPLNVDTFAILELCELIILFANSKKFIGKHTSVGMLQLEVNNVMKQRISSMVDCVLQNNPNNVLTTLLHLVNPSAPSDLIWKPLDTSSLEGLSSCFQSHDPRLGVSYAINLVNGCVLTDGYSSGTLPLAMRQQKKYKELFGKRNFEVNVVRGVYRTTDNFGGWYFDFFMESDELLVQKVRMDDDCQKALITMQLCKSSWVEKLSETLPLRLQDMHSHWYWLEKRCVLFLPKKALASGASFVIAYKVNNPAKCYDVSTSPAQSYEQLIDHLAMYDFFVDDILNIVGILSKFEPKQFIHVRQTPHGKMVFELPRFRLSFWINDSFKLESSEYKGYVLSRNQQLTGVFPRFSRYLVLALSDPSDITRPHLRLLVPEGIVVSNKVIDIDVPSESCAKLCVVSYDEHLRLKSFQAESISARLELTAIYASTGTAIPDTTLNMTGIEAALQTLRQCRSSRPFTPDERKFVLNICNFCFREPAMKLMLSMMVENSHRLSFLAGEENSCLAVNCHFEKDEYLRMCKQSPTRNSWRVRLRDAEERFYFCRAQCQKNSYCLCRDDFVDLESIPVQGSYVSDAEVVMLTKLIFVDSSPKESRTFPLKLKQKNVLRDEMNEELHLSWNIHHSQDAVSIQASSVGSLESFFSDSLSEVANKRNTMEQYLQRSISRAREDTCSQLQSTINYIPALTIPDILRCTFDDHALLELAPRFSVSSRLKFKEAALIYMELCVLEDKLGRLTFNAGKNPPPPEAYFIDELKTVRQWKTSDYPCWLAFEVEGQLQIRHEQLVIAKHLIENPSAVCQLNMGRGKTRVILPMLFLYFNIQSPKIVRAHFLSPLLSETRNYMHRYLSAGTVLLHFFEQPFHRKVELDVEKIHLMQEALEEVKSCGGFLIVAPEYRLSLELKRWQLSGGKGDEYSDTVECIDALLQKDQYIDVLDECDAILHHKYHLVYAMGFPQKLENGSHRWIAAQSLLHAISSSQSSRIAEMLQLPNVCSRKPEYDCRMGAFDGLRLATNLEDELKFRALLKEAFANDLIDHAPFELSWLGALGKVARQQLVQVLGDPKSSIDPLLKYVGSTCYRNELLALRGLIAFGIMEHCLEKRHRVDYGLPEPGSRPKMLAIPFRAADIPSERSEFSHPDVGIVLTLLAYYHSGLRESEIKRAFQILLDLDVSKQQTHYSAWYNSVKDRLPVVEQTMLSKVEFISLDDPRTLNVLCKVYKYAMKVINFYLSKSVFPRDTTQYPQRISRSAWNLTTGEINIGFSGTNDNHRLLPSAVTQLEPNEPSLRGTNGKMVDLILKVSQGYEVISQDDNSVIAWEALLKMALAKKTNALIDTGAILAGVFNHDAALFVLRQEEFSYSGVTYYDTRPDWDSWVVLEREQRVITPLKKSSMLERDTFVIFDEARSRGSDMKLYPHAMAVLTLGPKLTKDKLMQGAGRMRLLGCDQTLWIVSMNEVAQSILKSSERRCIKEVTVIDILNWIMDNTRSEAIHGLLEWASSGLHFNQTQINRNAELVDEDWSLETLYEAPQDLEMIANIVRSRVQRIYGDGIKLDGIVDEVCKKAHRYGMDDEVFVAVQSDECEREFQVENILQLEEIEIVKNCLPHSEKLWDYKRVLSANSAKTLPSSVIETRALEAYVKNNIKPAGMSQILWSNSNIVGTVNFFSTIVVKSTHRGVMNEFARIIDAFLLFPDNSVLLLSELEADHILELFWKSSSRAACRFMNLSYTLDSINGFEREACEASHVPRSLGSPLNFIPLTAIAACSLFNGNVKFGRSRTKHLEDVVRTLLESLSQREATLQEFVVLRGYAYTWSRSFLHELSHVMDLRELTKHNA